MIEIFSDSLVNQHTGKNDFYKINLLEGFNEIIQVTSQTDKDWTKSRADIVDNHVIPTINAIPNPSNSDIQAVLTDYIGEDRKWSWANKAIHLTSDEYTWFTLTTLNNKTQAIALIFHPKASDITGDPIFYIDFIASAPWNRDTPRSSKVYGKGGSILIGGISKWFIDNHNYTTGFSLHALPKAEGFYNYIGMQDLGIDTKKENLRKFEMAQSEFNHFITGIDSFIGVNNV